MKKYFFATLIIAALIVVMGFTLTSCDFFNRGNGSDNNNGSGSSNSGNTADGSDVKSREDMANIVRHISDALFADIGYTPQSSAPSNAAPISDDVFSEENRIDNPFEEDAISYVAIAMASVSMLADLYENDNYPLTDNVVLVNGDIISGGHSTNANMTFYIQLNEADNNAQILIGTYQEDSFVYAGYYFDIDYNFSSASIGEYICCYCEGDLEEEKMASVGFCYGRKNSNSYYQYLTEDTPYYTEVASCVNKCLKKSDWIVSEADYSEEFTAYSGMVKVMQDIYG